jgi:integral membrane sensor domain MASE1
MQCGGSCAHGWLIERFFGSGFRYFHGSTAPVLTTWQRWFASDALGIVAVAPRLIGLASAARERPSQSEIIEGGMAFMALVVLAGLVVSYRECQSAPQFAPRSASALRVDRVCGGRA